MRIGTVLVAIAAENCPVFSPWSWEWTIEFQYLRVIKVKPEPTGDIWTINIHLHLYHMRTEKVLHVFEFHNFAPDAWLQWYNYYPLFWKNARDWNFMYRPYNVFDHRSLRTMFCGGNDHAVYARAVSKAMGDRRNSFLMLLCGVLSWQGLCWIYSFAC